MTHGVLSFGYGVAAALAIPSLLFGAFAGMVPHGNGTMGGLLLACALLAIVPAAFASLGFFGGAKAFNVATDAPLFKRGVITGVIAVIVFVTLYVTGLGRNAIGDIGLLAGVFLLAGAAAAYAGRVA